MRLSEELLHRCIRGVGNQRGTFNTNSVNILAAMQVSWNAVFSLEYPLRISRHTPVYDIVSG